MRGDAVTEFDPSILTADAADWLADAVATVRRDRAALPVLFASVGRRCGRAALREPAGWTVDDAVRVVLLRSVGTAALTEVCADLYAHGDPAERRGVLRALDVLDIGADGLPLVRDALRGNDTRLVIAALGRYAAERLPDAEFRHAVLKCLFLGIELRTIVLPAARIDGELARMAADFAHERVAAGRTVPVDTWTLLLDHPSALDGVIGELDSAVPARRAAATRALDAYRAIANERTSTWTSSTRTST
jgi:hypothetical protein